MGIMYSFSGLDYLGDKADGFIVKFSFGNMGFPQAMCSKARIDWSGELGDTKLMFQCQGTTQVSSIIMTGIMYDKDLSNGGYDEDAMLRCYQDEEQVAGSPMMPYFNQEKFNEYLQAECYGKQLCYPQFDVSEFHNLPENLHNENILLYAQVGCSQTEEMLE